MRRPRRFTIAAVAVAVVVVGLVLGGFFVKTYAFFEWNCHRMGGTITAATYKDYCSKPSPDGRWILLSERDRVEENSW